MDEIEPGLVLTGLSCSRRGDTKHQVAVCFAFQDSETGFWVAAHKAILEILRSKVIKVIERNGNQDANGQLEQIRAAIAPGVGGIIAHTEEVLTNGIVHPMPLGMSFVAGREHQERRVGLVTGRNAHRWVDCGAAAPA